jgi:hypothetical protein
MSDDMAPGDEEYLRLLNDEEYLRSVLAEAETEAEAEINRELLPEHYFLWPSTAPAKRLRQRKPPKPSVGTLIAQAEKTGRNVTSITTPDGYTIRFGEPVNNDSGNSWDEVLENAPHPKWTS